MARATVIPVRRLFWKVYLTLLGSLLLVAVLLGSLWWLTGESPQERWGAFRLRLADAVLPEANGPPEALTKAIGHLGNELHADISVYTPGGDLAGSRGEPIALPRDEDMGKPWMRRVMRLDLPDGRTVMARIRPPPRQPGLRILTLVLIVAGGVGLAAFPLTARLTRRLEDLRAGVRTFGAGALSTRVAETGSDEVAMVARAFNDAAARIETLLTAQKALLANASHELRSPLARLRMAVEIWADAPTPAIREEIARNLSEVDQLVEEILLASRLDHPQSPTPRRVPVDLLGLAAEEGARADASVSGVPLEVEGDPTLLRRLIRNLVENARKHGAPPIEVHVAPCVAPEGGFARLTVTDHGAGIAEAERERVFEAFYRPAGRAESAGGWGLGLSLVRQIAVRHGGRVTCEAPPEGGTRMVVDLALAPAP